MALERSHLSERKIGVEIESFYYRGNDFSRIPVNYGKKYSALDLLTDISDEARKNNEPVPDDGYGRYCHKARMSACCYQ